MKQSPLTNSAAVELVAIIAEALHVAHTHGVVHRDVKPANILIDASGKPYLADFGIALRDEDFGTGYTRIGTVSYMSPEQLRGEGHLVDGRADIYSLGVVLYELITGRRPFSSKRLDHHLTQIEPKPPRQIDDTISKELERICLKALSYKVTDRYSTASDMSSDLRLLLLQGHTTQAVPLAGSGASDFQSGTSNPPRESAASFPIDPKGLRSYNKDDADFFLDLLPGPRDRDGLPKSVRFWTSRIQATGDETFRIGVIYGPSGCGKSSLLKAGVLPRVTNTAIPLYIEATPTETEARLLKALRSCSHREGKL